MQLPADVRKPLFKKDVLVRVSALALLAAPCPFSSARAQNLQISCGNNIFLGELIASGCAGGYVISPDGNHQNNGCLIVNSAAQAGSCIISVTGGTATKSAAVSFTKAAFLPGHTKMATSVRMDTLRMKLRSQPTIFTKITLGVTALLATKITIDVGGTLDYSNMQPSGSYSGKVSVVVDFVP